MKTNYSIAPIPVSGKIQLQSFLDNGDGSRGHYLKEWLRLKRIYEQGIFFQGEKEIFEKEMEEARLKSRLSKYKFLDEYNSGDSDFDVKVNGKQAHYSYEYCRLSKYYKECQVGKINDPINWIVTEDDKVVLKNETEEALRLSKSFF